MKEIIVKAPAKINLGLNVISKRDDGYHNIETIFYPTDLCDTLTFKQADEYKLTTSSEELIYSTNNLVTKAKELLEKEAKKKINIHIHLEKNIPVGAGLGGGSSDAAAVLSTLNKLFSMNLNNAVLHKLALMIGSDVPFFLDPKTCYASSRGENFEERSLRINYPLVIITPGVNISTKWAYENIIPVTPVFNLKDLTQEHLNAPSKLSKIIKNDFENLVVNNFPEIKKMKDKIESSKPLFSLMSGSGSSFYCIFEKTETAEEFINTYKKEYFTFLQTP